jgi:hypothetical protein
MGTVPTNQKLLSNYTLSVIEGRKGEGKIIHTHPVLQ